MLFGLGEIIGQSINMRASTCPSPDTVRANPHLEALDQHKSPKMKANHVVLVRACHTPKIKHMYRYTIQFAHHQMNHKEQSLHSTKSSTLEITSS